VLDQLSDVADENRTAYFICVAALYLPNGKSHSEEGRFYGTILKSPVGENGFGYDPIFQPDGLAISSAQMSSDEKDEVSHRGKALRAIAPHVMSALNSLG
ncbi:MAG: hypothetical protein RJA33_1497, partial [Actinomycetota bacterium]